MGTVERLLTTGSLVEMQRRQAYEWLLLLIVVLTGYVSGLLVGLLTYG